MYQPLYRIIVQHFTDNPRGPRLIESFDSRMVVACAPWAEWQTLAKEVRDLKCAAYVLAGLSYPEGVVARVYIGETGDWKRRLSEHSGDAKKRFTAQVFVIGSRDPNYDKIDAQLLQHSLDAGAEELDRAHIVRGVKPLLPRVDAMRTLAAKADFEDVQRLLPTAGCTILDPRGGGPAIRDFGAAQELPFSQRDTYHSRHREIVNYPRRNNRSHDLCISPAVKQATLRSDLRDPNQPPALYVLEHAGLTAYGYQHYAEFVVLPGSHMRRQVKPSFQSDAQNMQRRTDIIDARAVSEVRGYDDRWRLKFERRLPSAPIAAKVLMGVNLKADAWCPVNAGPREA